MADNGVIKARETDDPTTLETPLPTTRWFGVDSIGFWIKDSNDVIVRPDIGTGFNYQQAWDLLTLTVSNSWHVVNTPYTNAIIEVTMSTNSNNRTAGVRAVGTADVRSRRLDIDSPWSIIVETDNNGDIECFSSLFTDTEFHVSSKLK